MRNSSSQFKRAKSLQNGAINRVDDEFPTHNFVEVKQKIIAIFVDLEKHPQVCDDFVAKSRIADENEHDIKKFSSEVRLSNVAFKLHDIDENC